MSRDSRRKPLGNSQDRRRTTPCYPRSSAPAELIVLYAQVLLRLVTVPDLALFATTALILGAIPGPNSIYIATRSIGGGSVAGLASAAGVECGTLLHTVAAAVGLSALVASSDAAFDLIRYAGAAYLMFLGIRALRTPATGSTKTQPGACTATAALRQGVTVQLLNPKVILFFLAFLPQFLDAERGAVATQTLVLERCSP